MIKIGIDFTINYLDQVNYELIYHLNSKNRYFKLLLSIILKRLKKQLKQVGTDKKEIKKETTLDDLDGQEFTSDNEIMKGIISSLSFHVKKFEKETNHIVQENDKRELRYSNISKIKFIKINNTDWQIDVYLLGKYVNIKYKIKY